MVVEFPPLGDRLCLITAYKTVDELQKTVCALGPLLT